MRRLFFLLLLTTLLGVVLAGAGYLFLRHEAPAWGGAKVLTLTLDAPLREHDVEPTLPFVGDEERVSLSLLYRGFLAARTDPSVVAVALNIHDASFGLATAQELRRQIAELDRAGEARALLPRNRRRGRQRHARVLRGVGLLQSRPGPGGRDQSARPLRRQPLPARRSREAQDRSELPDRRRIQERRRDLHRGAALAGGESGARGSAGQLLQPDRGRHRRRPRDRRGDRARVGGRRAALCFAGARVGPGRRARLS